MSQLHKFMFNGLPIRGALVQLTTDWQEILQRRENQNSDALTPILGELTAAAILLQSGIHFHGTLILQVAGDAASPLALMVAEVQHNLVFRATATLKKNTIVQLDGDVDLTRLFNQNGEGRCAVILDPKEKLPGQQPYQGVVPLSDHEQKPIENVAQAIGYYLKHSQQLDSILVLAANQTSAVGMILQKMPVEGAGNLENKHAETPSSNTVDFDEEYTRLATFVASLKPEELLSLDVEMSTNTNDVTDKNCIEQSTLKAHTLLHRLFWNDDVTIFPPSTPKFGCSCSRERIAKMIESLGKIEAKSILAEQGCIEVKCEFCGVQQRFDANFTNAIFAESTQTQ